MCVGRGVKGGGGRAFCSSHSPRFEHRTGTWHFSKSTVEPHCKTGGGVEEKGGQRRDGQRMGER